MASCACTSARVAKPSTLTMSTSPSSPMERTLPGAAWPRQFADVMCGIAGILDFDTETTVDESRLRRMRDVLRHRGPDDEGLAVLGHVGLVHRRLSIIDIEGGHQPMSTGDRSIWISYNGEIYNFRELRATLVAKGCRFATQSDTE